MGITDDYGAYKNIFAYHQLCWSHPLRKLRELAKSEKLDNLKKSVCMVSYTAFSELYHDLEDVLKKPFELSKREEEKKRLMRRFDEIAKITGNEIEKLRKIKESLTKNREKYFTCVTIE